mgnify:CR=1 FL=1|jgi:hypothetical protein
MKISVFIFSVLFMVFQGLQAQEISKKYQIVLKDGNVLKGKLLEINKTFWVLETESLGIIEIPFENIKIFEVLDKNQEATEYSTQEAKSVANAYNPVPDRYLFMPSAFSPEAQSGNYQTNLLLFTGANYGFSDKFSAGFSTFLLPLPFLLSNLNFKLSHSINPSVHLALQANNIIVPAVISGFRGFQVVTNPNILLTLGNRRKNVTMGLGILFSPSAVLGTTRYTTSQLQISAIIPMTWRTFLVTQNIYQDFNDFALLSSSLAFRLVRKNHLFDAGVMIFSVQDYAYGDLSTIPLPYFGWQIAFGRNKTKSYKVTNSN